MKRITLISMMLFFWGFLLNAQTNGEVSDYNNGTPTQDHFFVRSTINESGMPQLFDNVVSFNGGDTQLVWIYLDDDEIYLNEAIQALPHQEYKKGHPYNEITYNSFQFDVYLPKDVEIIVYENEDGDEIYAERGDRLPNTSTLTWAKKEGSTKYIDGIAYDVYTFACYNDKSVGTHFSARNASQYEANGALKKDATLFGIYLRNKRQDNDESRIDGDMILGNMLLTLNETDEIFFFGTKEEGQNRFMQYNRVELYSSYGSDIVYANSIYLNKNYADVTVDETLQLTATVLPYNTSNKTVVWSSSNSSVASVTSEGLVTAHKAGTATITATTTDGTNLSASCNLTVSNRLATSIVLNKTNTTMDVGTTEQLVATVYPSNATNKTVTWRSSNTSVASVSNNGLVTAISPGNATITATTTDGSNLSASCSVKVNNILATSISVTPSSLTLEIDETSTLTAIVFPSNTTNQSVTWRSGNTAIATVNSNGLVTAISPGSVNITATTKDGSNLSATCRVTVNERIATSITLNKSSLSLYVNQTSQLTATVYPNDTGNKTVAWKSSNNSVATVSNNGMVTAIAPGDAIITATTTDGSNLSASCDVTVSIIPVSSVSLNQTSLTLDIEDTYQLVSSIVPSNATYKTLTWKSSNNAVALVNNDGLITPIAPGNATITATTTDGTNITASCQVTVIKRVKAISLSESSLILILPESAQLIAYVTPSDATNASLTWSSTNTSVATVDAYGIVTPVAVGTATIKATTTDGTNLTASCQVTVKRQLVTSLTLNESLLTMHIGDMAQLVASVAPDNASNKTLTWRSSNSSIATVDNSGLVTAISGGTATITASTTDGSYLNAYCTIEVIPDYYITLDTLSHIRGAAAQIADLKVSLVNKNPISGIQFDVSLPSDISFNIVGDMPDVWLDDARSTRSHSVIANRLSNGSYRVLVTSSSSKDLRGNEGVLVHMNMVLPQMHSTGYSMINVSNIIASESDETRHALNNQSTFASFYYLVGDADANGIVDIADHAATASKILGKNPSPFYYDAANVDGNYSLEVVDLVGITNIALEIKPQTVRQAPAYGRDTDKLFCDKINVNAGGEAEINIGMDCAFDFAGFQMDLDLPRGLSLTNASLGEMASSLDLAIEPMDNGKIRILGSSFSDAEFSGLCSKLLTLKLKADRTYQRGEDIEFSDVIFAERNLTGHYLDATCIEYVEPSTVYELMDEARIYVENGNIIVDTPVSGTVQLIAVDGRMMEYEAHVGHNVYPIDVTGIYIVHFNGKTIKVRL